MENKAALERIEFLRKTLKENSLRYYVDNAPVISDFEFDHLMRELEDLERQYPQYRTPDSPTAMVGSDLQAKDGFRHVAHKHPMLSLANTYSIAEIEDFARRADKLLDMDFSYCCELKFDGTAICLTYVDGKLSRALTRGDGEVGDDVTENVLRISNIPKTLEGDYPHEFEIRGEVLMPYEAFDKLNKERKDAEEAPFANPRNAASGSLKLLNPEEVARRGLWCTLYHIPAQSIEFATHDQALNAARRWGLPVSDERRLCRNIEEIEQYISYWDEHRKFLPYATDGIVIKINELQAQRELSSTAKSPRWAVAFKFQAERALSKVLSIDYQVGRTGAVTPVANLEPSQLSGTVVKRATLNNADQMELLDIRIGDSVYVEKGGEIIPKITGVELKLRPAGSAVPDFPKVCPDCGTPLVRKDDEAKWFCPNTDGCPMQIKGRILHFVSRKAMNILAGEATVEQLYDLDLVKTPADLYDLHKNQLMLLEGWQEKSAERFLQSLEQSKSAGFDRVLYALGIRFVGDTKAKDIARYFKDIDALAAASLEDIEAVPNVGEVVATSVYNYLLDARHAIEIQRLRAHGLHFSTGNGEPANVSDKLAGMTVVISGVFSIPRDDMKKKIEVNGGRNSSSISSKTSFLLAGSKPGPEKIARCGELGVRIISEDEFNVILGEDSSLF